MLTHKQKKIHIDLFNSDCDVDEELANLLFHMNNNHQIYTTLSCQENFPGIIWIEFFNGRSARRFANKTHKLFMNLDWASSARKMKGNSVRWDTCPINLNEEIVNDEVVEVGKPHYIFNIGVRFPKRFLPDLEKMFSK